MDRAQRHSAMVDFMQYSKRETVVLEEDHEKVENENAQLRAELDGLTEQAREKEVSYFRLQSEVQNLRAALAGQQQAEPLPVGSLITGMKPHPAVIVDLAPAVHSCAQDQATD